MLIDAREIEPNFQFQTDICIVGGGVAGIVLARELIKTSNHVTLVESGGFDPDLKTQALYQGQNVGNPYFDLEQCRLRYFGGTSNHWHGFCTPLREIDFEKRSWVPQSGWPFNLKTLEPYYKKAQTLCELGPFRYESSFWKTHDEDPPIPFDPTTVETRVYQFSPPTRFGSHYRDEILKASNLNVHIYANALELEMNASGQKINRVKISSLKKNPFFVKAKLFILAMGGIENPRLLLLSNKVQKRGIGNQHDLVGRYFMEHLHAYAAVLAPSQKELPLGFYENVTRLHNSKATGFLSISPSRTRKEKLLGFSSTFYPGEVPKSVEAVWGSRRAVKQGRLDEFRKNLSKIIRNLDEVGSYYYQKKILKKDLDEDDVWSLYVRSEQSPNPLSRVRLGSQKDALGQLKVELHWELDKADLRSIESSLKIIGREFGRLGWGRLRMDLDPDTILGGKHHMGTTRMNEDPQKGVVNRDCRVHGVSNLYMAGSSVFPTSGYANPTLTIVALTLRLAEHLRSFPKG